MAELTVGAKPKEKPVNEIPVGSKYTMTVPLDDSLDKKGNPSKTATFHLKGMDEDVFGAAQKMIENGKEFDAIRMVIKALWVGGDSPELLTGNFIAVQSASFLVKKMLAPIPGELKKN